MGIARGECLSKRLGSSCSCPPREFNARWKRQARAAPRQPPLAAAPPRPLPQKAASPRSRGHGPPSPRLAIRQVSQPHISRLMTVLKYAKSAATGAWGPARGRAWAQQRAAAGTQRGCSCVIRLTVLNGTATGGHKFKLTSLMSGFYTGNLVGQAAQWAADYDLI